MRLKEYYPEKNNILLGEVNVKAKSYSEKYKNDLYGLSERPLLLTPEHTAGMTSIIDFLIYKVPGVYGKYAEGFTNIAIGSPNGGTPAIFIDGFQSITVDQASIYPVDMFESIQIIRPPSSYIYGSRAMHGAVLLIIKSGESMDREVPLLGGMVDKINGFSPLREFYSPKYSPENIHSEAPDYRNTLYWNPKVIIENGEKEIYFFTCDNVSRYKIFVEGITESGKICLGSAEFEVGSRK